MQVRTQAELAAAGALPRWLRDPDFHRSHQSFLLRKDAEHDDPVFPGYRTTCRTSGPCREGYRLVVAPSTPPRSEGAGR